MVLTTNSPVLALVTVVMVCACGPRTGSFDAGGGSSTANDSNDPGDSNSTTGGGGNRYGGAKRHSIFR